jgi:hypothetical protein
MLPGKGLGKQINPLFFLVNIDEQNMNKPIKYQRKKVDRSFIE